QDLDLKVQGDFQDLLAWLDQHGMPARPSLARADGGLLIGNNDGQFPVEEAERIWTHAGKQRLGRLQSYLVSALTPENRLGLLSPTQVHNVETEVPTHPL